MIALVQATKIINRALAEVAAKNFEPLFLIVLDAGGRALLLKRNERAWDCRPESAISKAAGCLGLAFGGREVAGRAGAVPGFIGALNSIVPKGICRSPAAC